MKNKYYIITYAAMAFAALGILLILIGAFGFGAATGVGANLNWTSNGGVITGLVFAGLSLLAALADKIAAFVRKEEKVLAYVAIEAACTALLFALIFLVLFTTWPLIFP